MKRSSISLNICVVAVVLSLAAVMFGQNLEASVESTEKSAPLYLENKEAVASDAGGAENDEKESVAKAEPAENAAETDLKAMEERLVAMLNMNYCYGQGFDDANEISIRAAVALRDYAVETEDGGFGVNKSLVAGFMKSFYGVTVDPCDIGNGQGYVMIPAVGCGEVLHTLVTITESEGEITVVTCAEIYSGGETADTFLAKSVFRRDGGSEFGYNLLFSELL